MKIYQCVSFNDKEIVLCNSTQLVELFNGIMKEENFIVSIDKDGNNESKVIIGANIKSRVENGDIELSSKN